MSTDSTSTAAVAGPSFSEGLGVAAPMRALSIRQPWAWFILHAGKDIENRAWPTKVRGRILVHAAKGMTEGEYEYGVDAAISAGADLRAMPSWRDIPRGEIVGSVNIVDCVEDSDSPWFVGRYGFVLRDPRPIVGTRAPWRGALGFFGVPSYALP